MILKYIGVGIGVENRIPISTPNEWRLCGIAYDVRYILALDRACECNRRLACVKLKRRNPQISNPESHFRCLLRDTID
jgi:hypothetical protein